MSVEYFFIKGNCGEYCRIHMEEVVWLESVRGGVIFNLVDGKTHMLTASMRSVLRQFKHVNLFRVHRSYAVNRSKISKLEHRTLVLESGGRRKLIPCSDLYWKEIKNTLLILRSD